MNLPHAILSFGLVCSVASLPARAEESAESDEQGTFPIVCFLGPPANDNRLEHWQRIKKANFTVVLPSYQYDDADQLKMLDHCRQVGLKAVVNVKRLAPPGSSTSPPADWRQQIHEAVDRYSAHPALYGYMVRDEPGADLYPQLARVVQEFSKRDPRHIVCINLFPVHASSAQLQMASYVEYLDLYLKTVKPPFLSYDHYPLLRDNSDRPDFFLNLALARAAGAKHKTPVWTVVLSGWGQHFRKPTPAELRWQVYAALAYGIRGLAYFAYWPSDDSYAAVVDYKGRPQPLYKAMRDLNGDVLALGRVLRGTTSTAVYHMGESIPLGCQRLPKEGELIQLPQHLPLVVGLFQSTTSEDRYALIVNRSYRESAKVTVNVRSDVEDVSIVAVTKNQPKAARSKKHGIVTVLPAGGATLLQLRMRAE